MADLVKVRVPDKFDPTRQKHVEAVIAAVVKEHGPGNWRFMMHDPGTSTAHVERRGVVSSARAARKDGAEVLSLGEGYGPADGEKAAAAFERLPDYAGYSMTEYDPYGGTATLMKLSADEKRCRSACANALGVKPWEVQVRGMRGGGFDVELPASYSPAKHDKKLEEVATSAVGKPGWYLEFDVRQLRMKIVPAELPTFPAGIPYPVQAITKVNKPGRLLFGQALGRNGNELGEQVFIDSSDGPHTFLQGTSGSGKSVTINALVAGALGAGMELAIGDVPAKAVDFTWARDYVRPGGWGCESLEENLAMLDGIYREGQQRARVFKQYDVQKISELPDHERAKMPLIFLVQDELAGILRKVNIPKSLPQEHPTRIAAEREAVVRDLTLNLLLRISAELRFVGVFGLFASQLATVNTGIPVELRTNSSNRLLMGVSASERQRTTALNNPELAPDIPAQVRNDSAAARGVGVAELPGRGTMIFKGMFATTEDYVAAIRASGVRKTPFDQARPSRTAIARALGEDLETPDFSGGPLPNDPDAGRVDGNGNPLKGAAAAAASHKANVTDKAPF
ncbi:MAG: FtsK/SpoIIIE domain-containing protein [Microbacteriaceae bacterium]